MKILLLTNEVWNDKKNTDNILSNWFDGSEVQLANLYLTPGLPDNRCCSRYFQITGKMMAKSLITGKKAGLNFNQRTTAPITPNDPEVPNVPQEPVIPIIPEEPGLPVNPGNPQMPVDPENPETPEGPEKPRFPETPIVPENPKVPIFPGMPARPKLKLPEDTGHLYEFFKSIATDSMKLIEDFIWSIGNYNIDELKKFLDEFNPDIIFSIRPASTKMLRFEKELVKFTKKPLAAFSDEDEFITKQSKVSPAYWIRHLKLNKQFKGNLSIYHKYYTLSPKQAELYKKRYRLDTDILEKCGDFNDYFILKEVHYPIRLVYAGLINPDLYDDLQKVKKALKKINMRRLRMTLEIYPANKITKHQKRQLEDDVQIFIKSKVLPQELKEVYKKADIALFIESFEEKNASAAKYSYPAEMIDCLASSSCILLLSPKENAGFEYMKEQDAAICVSDPGQIYSALKHLFLHHEKLYEYQKKAWDCGVTNHDKPVVQQKLYQDFANIIVSASDKE
jgi:hypothetical protein